MVDGGIFFKVGRELELLRPTRYDSEDVLQAALADYPQVIAGLTTDGEQTPLVLVAREISIPGTLFSLDHLFLDADSVPVLVEVKRASDTRIRREVVGQMLDYAANAAVNWPVRFLRETLEKQAATAGVSAQEYLAPVAGDLGEDEYWKRVETNLSRGRIRMMFVADELPESLVRIIEFCNEQMSPAEVLGVEVRQNTGGASAAGQVAYVPRVVGATSAAVVTKQASTGAKWTRETFVAEAESRCTSAELAVVTRLLEHVDQHGVKLAWGSGVAPGVGGWYDLNGRPTGSWALSVGWGNESARPTLVLYLGDVVKYVSPEHMDRFVEPLTVVPAFKEPLRQARAAGWAKWPRIYLHLFADDAAQVDAVFTALDRLAAGPTSDPSA